MKNAAASSAFFQKRTGLGLKNQKDPDVSKSVFKISWRCSVYAGGWRQGARHNDMRRYREHLQRQTQPHAGDALPRDKTMNTL
jgi:hypothetical protein